MTKSKKVQAAEAREKARQEELRNDPGKSPSDANKNESPSAPIDAGAPAVRSEPDVNHD